MDFLENHDIDRAYNRKDTVWKHRQEVQLYDSPIRKKMTNNTSPEERVKKPRNSYENMDLRERELSDVRREKYYKRRGQYLTDLAIHNELTLFVTLTFKEPVTSYDVAQHEWDLFLKRLKYRWGKDVKYICVHEIQKKRKAKTGDGVFHFHFLCDLGFVDQKELEALWGNGFVYVRRIDTSDHENQVRQISYLFKYLVKDIAEEHDTSLRKKARKVYSSRNLKRPVITKELTTEAVEDVVFDHMEDVISTGEYFMRNSRNQVINRVDVVKIRRGGN